MWGEDTRLQVSTHQSEDMRMQECKQEHMNLKIWGCKAARIQASTHEHKYMRMWGCKQVKYMKHVGYF